MTVVDNLTEQSAPDAVRNLVKNNKVVVQDVTIFTPVLPITKQNPDTTFIITSGFFKPGEVPANVHGYVDIYGYGSYPLGQIAATLTKNKKVGYISGPAFPVERTAYQGFKEGTLSQNPRIPVAETQVASFSDAPSAKQAAAAQIASGDDALFAFVDAGWEGVLQAAQESGKDVKMFGFVVNRCNRGNNIVANLILDYSNVVPLAIKDYMNKNLPVPTKAYGLEIPAVQRVVLCPKYRTPTLTKMLNTYLAGLKSGALKLPPAVTGQ